MGTEFIIVLSTYSVVLRSVLTKEAFICPIHGYFSDTLPTARCRVTLRCSFATAHFNPLLSSIQESISWNIYLKLLVLQYESLGTSPLH